MKAPNKKKRKSYRHILKPLALGAAILALASGCNEQQRCDSAKKAHAEIEHLALLMSQAQAPGHDDLKICKEMKPLHDDLVRKLGSMDRLKGTLRFQDGGAENRAEHQYAKDPSLQNALAFLKVSREGHVSRYLESGFEGDAQDLAIGLIPSSSRILADADNYCGWSNTKKDYIAPHDPLYPQLVKENMQDLRVYGQKVQDALCSDLEVNPKKYISAREYERDPDYQRIFNPGRAGAAVAQ